LGDATAVGDGETLVRIERLPTLRLRLSDPEYTERLAEFLSSLQLEAVVAGPAELELLDELARPQEMEIYLRVWSVLYPDARVDVDEAA
jgi:hypothetical protein